MVNKKKTKKHDRFAMSVGIPVIRPVPRLFSVLFFCVTCLVFISSCTRNHYEAPEMRAVWIHQGMFDANETRAAGQIDTLFTRYAGIGINNIFCFNALKVDNHLSWDFLRVLIDAGKRHSIGIHPILYPGYHVNLERALAEHPEWLIRDMQGQVQPHLNLALPEVRQYWIDRVKDALSYDIAGIHLDYIRFPLNQGYSYDSLTCAMFRQEWGFSPLEVSHDSGSMIWCEWIKWNARQVTALVTGIRDVINESGKSVLLGADVFPDAGLSFYEIGQDWALWMQTGLVDIVCPMLYTSNPEHFRSYVQQALEAADGKCAVYPGIGIATSHNRISKKSLVEEVEITRGFSCNGFAFFSGYSLTPDMIDTLRLTVLNQ